MMKNAFIFKQIKKDFLWEYSYKISFFGQFAGMFLTLMTFFFLSKTFEANQSIHLDAYANNYFLFSIIGVAFLDHFSILIRSLSTSIRSAQAFGYIDTLLHSQRSTIFVMLCMFAYPYIKGNLKFILYLFLASSISGFSLPLHIYALASLILFSSSLFFLGIAFLSGAFVLVYKQADPVNYLTNILISLFSGIIYPVSVLPNYLQVISDVIPATFSLELLRSLIFNGYLIIEVDLDLIRSFFITSIIVIISIIVFNFAITKVKKDGSSGKY
tara:strand:- start:304 stop:1116 length:813 start_codon:yes stop_codon:yes gene_type:complete